ncbi:ATP-dependent RNA helicase DDX52, putative [Babesia caballi]|uniref:ATP-dependent RNA helicase DDX52, putative n=1 Tax=Babesia caballi TaxID=5871 RepID=A0AAV4M0V0_BABCB|nr:ATP-dependent RNA helicase DDX52, putative [Babesia caballi]
MGDVFAKLASFSGVRKSAVSQRRREKVSFDPEATIADSHGEAVEPASRLASFEELRTLSPDSANLEWLIESIRGRLGLSAPSPVQSSVGDPVRAGGPRRAGGGANRLGEDAGVLGARPSAAQGEPGVFVFDGVVEAGRDPEPGARADRRAGQPGEAGAGLPHRRARRERAAAGTQLQELRQPGLRLDPGHDAGGAEEAPAGARGAGGARGGRGGRAVRGWLRGALRPDPGGADPDTGPAQDAVQFDDAAAGRRDGGELHAERRARGRGTEQPGVPERAAGVDLRDQRQREGAGLAAAHSRGARGLALSRVPAECGPGEAGLHAVEGREPAGRPVDGAAGAGGSGGADQPVPPFEDMGAAFVVNFDIPLTAQDYINRIGRSGRGETSGSAVTFFTLDDMKLLGPVVDTMRRCGQPVPEYLLRCNQRRADVRRPPKRQQGGAGSLRGAGKRFKGVGKARSKGKRSAEELHEEDFGALGLLLHHQAGGYVALQHGVVRPDLEAHGAAVETLVEGLDVTAANDVHALLHSLQHGRNEGADAALVGGEAGDALRNQRLVLLNVVTTDAAVAAGLLARRHEGGLAAHAAILLDTDAVVVEEVAGALDGAGDGAAEHAAAGAESEGLHDVAGAADAAVRNDGTAVAVLARVAGDVVDGSGLGAAHAADALGGADGAGTHADAEPVGARLNEVFGLAGGNDVAADDLYVGVGLLQLLDQVDLVHAVALAGVDDQDVGARLEHFGRLVNRTDPASLEWEWE